MRWLWLLLLLSFPCPVYAESCTDGTDCPADCYLGDGVNTNNFDSTCTGPETCDPAAEVCYDSLACCQKWDNAGAPIVFGFSSRELMFNEDNESIALYSDTPFPVTEPDGFPPLYDDGPRGTDNCSEFNNIGEGGYMAILYGHPEDSSRVFNPAPTTVNWGGCACDSGVCTGGSQGRCNVDTDCDVDDRPCILEGGGGARCDIVTDWTETDRWGSVISGSGTEENDSIDFVCTGANCPTYNDSFNAELAAIGIPDDPGPDLIPGNGDDVVDVGVFDGMGVWGQRYLDGSNGCGFGDNCAAAYGGMGTDMIPSPGRINNSFDGVTSFWIVMAHAAADNFDSSGIMGTCDDDKTVWCLSDSDCSVPGGLCCRFGLKEWGFVHPSESARVGEWMVPPSKSFDRDELFGGIEFLLDPFDEPTAAACASEIGGWDKQKGTATCSCNGTCGNIVFHPDITYDMDTDHGLGVWSCFQTKVHGLGTSNGTWEVWINNKKTIDFSGIDFSGVVMDTPSVTEWNLSHNANINQANGDNGSQETTRVWKDNIVAVGVDTGNIGTPLSCAQIGFSSASSGGATIGSMTIGQAP